MRKITYNDRKQNRLAEEHVEHLGCDQTRHCLQSSQRTSQLPMARVRHPPPSSQQTPYALVHQQQQRQYIPHPHSPLTVECASQYAAVQTGAHHCLSRVSPSGAKKCSVMICHIWMSEIF